MILSDKDIKEAILDGTITISPMPNFSDQLGSCKIDLRLGRHFRVFHYSRVSHLDSSNPDTFDQATEQVSIAQNGQFILQPGDFVLAVTIESFTLPDNLLARLEGKSSIARLGIVVHSTASIFEPGWNGNVVMELGNMGRLPVILHPGMRICALTFEQLTTPAEVPYSKKKQAKYKNQTRP